MAGQGGPDKVYDRRPLLHPPEGTHLIIVSNEVGFGLVPSYKMGRRFRDMQGRMNQLCASKADRAALIVAGYPLWLKGGMEDHCWK